MKYRTTAVTTLMICISTNAMAQTDTATYRSPLLGNVDVQNTEAPKTIKEKADRAAARHKEDLEALLKTLNQMADDPSLIGQQETIKVIETANQAFYRTQQACKAIRSGLIVEDKAVQSDPAFTKEEKEDLKKIMVEIDEKCAELASEAKALATQLKGIYSEMKSWRKVYKTYLNLENEAKAKEKLKVAVDGYVTKLTAKEEPEEVTTETAPNEEKSDEQQ